MATMGAYIVMSFFCAQFLSAFGQSNIGTMLALYGAEGLKAMDLPGEATVVGLMLSHNLDCICSCNPRYQLGLGVGFRSKNPQAAK